MPKGGLPMSDNATMGSREIQLDLILAIALSISVPSVIYSFHSATPLRFLIGLPYLFFVPGWVLASAIWVSRIGINLSERVAIAMGLSVMTSAAIGIALSSVTALTINNLLLSMSGTTVCATALAWFRRSSHNHDGEPFAITVSSLSYSLSGKVPSWRAAIVGIIATGIVISIMLSIVVINLDNEKHSTRFYLLGLDDTLGDLPKNMTVGEHNGVTVVFENWNGSGVTFRMDAIVNGTMPSSNYTFGTFDGSADDGAEWRESVELSFAHPDRYRVSFLIYLDGSEEPAYFLHYWVNVKGA
jgi:uncharacterized membrane protein